QRFTRANVNPQEMNRGNATVTNRGVYTPGQPQTNAAPATHGPMILRGGRTPQPQTGTSVQPQGQGVDPRFHGQLGNQTVVPQGRVVTPQNQQVQPRVVTPPPPQNRVIEPNRNQGGGNGG
ncbi:MAG TPA: hypothetical protein VKU84_12205, partial [Stellaceae bacterium]|nr:hypothetical protein [Stellaceae bacterium]